MCEMTKSAFPTPPMDKRWCQRKKKTKKNKNLTSEFYQDFCSLAKWADQWFKTDIENVKRAEFLLKQVSMLRLHAVQ